MIPNLQTRAKKLGHPWNFEATFDLEWIYGISYTCTPIIQFLVHNKGALQRQSGQNHAVVYACGTAAVVYDYYSHEQHYYLHHKVWIFLIPLV